MKKTVRINITNKCNLSCPTCYIYGSPKNDRFMSFSTFQDVLCGYSKYPIEVVLEGGEPFLHPRLYLFLEYLDSISNFKKVIISTNGMFLPEHYDNITSLVKRLKIKVHINVAITSMLIKQSATHLQMCKDLYIKGKNGQLPFGLSFDVTYISEEDKENIISLLESNGIHKNDCSFSIVKAYGQLKNTEYPKIECDNDSSWVCYATDGMYFGNDLSGRADYEYELSQGIVIPVFDDIHHKDLWIETQVFLAGISFETQDNVKCTIEEFQREYIKQHQSIYTKGMVESGFLSYAEFYMSLFNSDDVRFNPFCIHDICGTSLKNEIYNLFELMMSCDELKRFYHYKDIIVKLCHKMAYLPVKEEINTTSNQCRRVSCG